MRKLTKKLSYSIIAIMAERLKDYIPQQPQKSHWDFIRFKKVHSLPTLGKMDHVPNWPSSRTLENNETIQRTKVPVVSFFILTGLEYERERLVKGMDYKDPGNIHTLIINPDNPISSVLRNSGDLWDGFVLSGSTYIALTLLNSIQKLATHRELSYQMRLGLSMVVGAAAVIAYETGYAPVEATSDLADIPAGVFGALLYGISYLAGRKLTKDETKLHSK